MNYTLLLLTLVVLSIIGYYMGRGRARVVADGRIDRLHSLPSYYGANVAIWGGLPAFILFAGWASLQGPIIQGLVFGTLPDQIRMTVNGDLLATAKMTAAQKTLFMNNVQNLATGDIVSQNVSADVRYAAAQYERLREVSFMMMVAAMLIAAAVGTFFAYRAINPTMRARNMVERVISGVMLVCSTLAVLTTVGIVLSLLFESFDFFTKVSPIEFLFGTEWSPQTAIRQDQVGSSGAFGAIPVFAGTLLITVIAMIVAVPVGLYAAIYLSEYARPRIRATVKPVMEILAGIPTVVYGFFAALTVAPFIRDLGASIGLDVASESALAAGVVMGVMIIPFVSSLSDDVINAVPQSLRDGSYGLGATRSETIRAVILPAALPGIVGAVLLAVSRAIGETMIVVMAAGLSANLTANPFEAVTTVTVQIVTNLTGDPEFDSPKTLSAFALGLVLFVVTLCLNVVALRVVQKYREKYE